MKRAAIILITLLILALGGAVLAFNAGFFHTAIEQKVSAALEAKTQLGAIRLLYRWPLSIHVGRSTINHPLADISWQSADLEIHQLTAPYGLVVELDQPNVEMKSPPPTAQTAPIPAKSTAASRGPAVQLKIALRIKNGVIVSPWASIRELNLDFTQKLFMRTPAAIHATALVKATAFPLPLPLKVDTDTLIFNEDTVKTSALDVSFGGLSANVQGTSLLNESRHRWLLDISAKDLSQLPPPPVDFGAKKWKGSIQLHAEVSKDAVNKPWQAEGHVQAANVGAEIQFKQDLLKISGPFLLNAEGKFSYLNEQPSTPGIKASLDLSGAQVIYGDILSKAPGVAMRAEVQVVSDSEKLNFPRLDMQLWNFLAQLKGGVQAKAPFAADLHFALTPVNLDGAEKMLLPLSKSPVQGELSLAGNFSGNLSEPKKAHVRIENFQMRKFHGQVDFEKPGLVNIKGPVFADIQAQGEWQNEKLKSAKVQGGIDLSAASLVAGPLRKEAKAILKTKLNIRNAGNSLLIDELELATFFGNFGVKGKCEISALPTLDLALELKPLNLSELRIALPSFHDLIPKGTTTGTVQIAGKVELSKAWKDWPLSANGKVKTYLPEYKMTAAVEEPKAAKGSPAPPPTASSFLPDGVLTRRLKLALQVDVDQFTKDTLEATGLHVEGHIAAGKFAGMLNIQHIFGGSFSIKNLSVPLLQTKPAIQGTASWVNLTIEDALGFAKPDYRKMAEGKISGLAEFSTLMPSDPDFMKQLRTRGDAAAQPVTLNSVKIGQLINDALGKVPMLKLKPVKVEPLKGQIKTQFDLNSGTLDLASFTAVDADNSEIQMKGKVNIGSMQGDLAGTFFWAKPQVTGCWLEGNADDRGRMVIPLSLKGDLMSPGLSILSDLVGKLGAKALQCEQKKLIDKVKTQGKEQLEKELKKRLKNILGN